MFFMFMWYTCDILFLFFCDVHMAYMQYIFGCGYRIILMFYDFFIHIVLMKIACDVFLLI
jgi:hypothetical protein